MNITLGLEVSSSWIKEREERKKHIHSQHNGYSHTLVCSFLPSFIPSFFSQRTFLFLVSSLLQNERESTSWSNWTPALSSSRKEVLPILTPQNLSSNWSAQLMISRIYIAVTHTHTHLFSPHYFPNSFNPPSRKRKYSLAWLSRFPFSLQSRI